MAICPKHPGKELKGPNSKGNYWHVVNFETKEFCNIPASEIREPLDPATSQPIPVGEVIKERYGLDDAKDRQSLTQTAMNCAANITAAYIQAGGGAKWSGVEIRAEVKSLARELYRELQKIKNLKDLEE